jgi:hypothetical protein
MKVFMPRQTIIAMKNLDLYVFSSLSNAKFRELLIWRGNKSWVAKLETMIKISKLEIISPLLKLKINSDTQE